MNTIRICSSCLKPLPPDAPEGLCPECLVKAGLGSQPDARSGQPPPTPEQMAPHFPQLEILELLGQGGMGVVYKARQKQLDRVVALKVLPVEAGRDPTFAERFAREARSLARLNHPNIVAIYDFGQSGGYYYFLMEFVDGLNLRQMLRAGRIAPREALAIVPKICEALQYAHDQGVVHRDIKPENILLDKEGRVKIADFGLAKILGPERESLSLTGAHAFMGTPHYMAPEQMERPGEVDHRADIFSLGVVFYEMLTGELPLGRFPLPSQKVQVDVRLDEVVLRALEKEPARRYQHASEVKTQVEDITGVLANLPPRVRGLFGYEYKSQRMLFGLPLVHVATGLDPATGRKRVAKGILAIGDVAKGVLAFGGMAFGGVACGGVSVGIVSLGGMAVGLLAGGGGAIALLFAFGGFALAPIALGGGAVGYYACGGGAWGVHAVGGNVQDPVARAFFMPWAQQLTDWWTRLIPLLVLGFLTISCIPVVMWRKARNTASAIPTGSRGQTPAPPTTTGTSHDAGEAATPRFSRKALWGAVWAPLAFLAVASLFVVSVQVVRPGEAAPAGPEWWQTLLAFTLLPLGAAAPFGTTILGLMAIHDIRHSRGRICGLPLAVADALLFPLLALDVLIGLFCHHVVRLVWSAVQPAAAASNQSTITGLSLVLTLLVAAVVDVFLIVRAWRAAKRPPPNPLETGVAAQP